MQVGEAEGAEVKRGSWGKGSRRGWRGFAHRVQGL